MSRRPEEIHAVRALFLQRFNAAGRPADQAQSIMEGCLNQLREARKSGRVAEFIDAAGVEPEAEASAAPERPKVRPHYLPEAAKAFHEARRAARIPDDEEPEPDEARYFGI